MPTAIEWCDETFNPWWGCEKVSPGCAHCYAEGVSNHRAGKGLWGAGHGFRFFGDKHWAEPLRWARRLPEKLGRRPRVFCASMADVFEERPELDEPRARLFDLIRQTPELDWLILTKRPGYACDELERLYDYVQYDILEPSDPLGYLPNVWLGVSIENARFTWRADVLREIPATVRFLSCEPLLGSLFDAKTCKACGTFGGDVEGWDGDIPYGWKACPECRGRGAHGPLDLTGIDWLIVGGESGSRARAMRLEWARELVVACDRENYHRSAGDLTPIRVFVKQLGAKPIETHPGPEPPASAISYPLRLRDRKGGDIDEWSADLRIREFPQRQAVPA